MKWSDSSDVLQTETCSQCGAKVQNMTDHWALFHQPKTDEWKKTRKAIVMKITPGQTVLDDTGESGDAYNAEHGQDPNNP